MQGPVVLYSEGDGFDADNGGNRPTPPTGSGPAGSGSGAPGGKGGRPGGPSRASWIYFAFACILLGYAFWSLGGGLQTQGNSDELATSDFVAAVEDGRVHEATYTVADGSVSGTYWPEGEKKTKDNLEQFNSTYVGSDSLAALMAEHPKTTYKVDTEDPAYCSI